MLSVVYYDDCLSYQIIIINQARCYDMIVSTYCLILAFVFNAFIPIRRLVFRTPGLVFEELG